MTFVVELLYRNILTQLLWLEVEMSWKVLIAKRLYLFCRGEKMFINLPLLVESGRWMGAVTLWALSIRTMALANSSVRNKSKIAVFDYILTGTHKPASDTGCSDDG